MTKAVVVSVPGVVSFVLLATVVGVVQDARMLRALNELSAEGSTVDMSCHVRFKDPQRAVCHEGQVFLDFWGPSIVQRLLEHRFGCSAQDVPVLDTSASSQEDKRCLWIEHSEDNAPADSIWSESVDMMSLVPLLYPNSTFDAAKARFDKCVVLESATAVDDAMVVTPLQSLDSMMVSLLQCRQLVSPSPSVVALGQALGIPSTQASVGQNKTRVLEPSTLDGESSKTRHRRARTLMDAFPFHLFHTKRLN